MEVIDIGSHRVFTDKDEKKGHVAFVVIAPGTRKIIDIAMKMTEEDAQDVFFFIRRLAECLDVIEGRK